MEINHCESEDQSLHLSAVGIWEAGILVECFRKEGAATEVDLYMNDDDERLWPGALLPVYIRTMALIFGFATMMMA
ncbi:MAG: hypothetical protein U5L96_14115 [Owenweeksia sp.]|nr:hypothetical protein [Owenweeksia sp.]